MLLEQHASEVVQLRRGHAGPHGFRHRVPHDGTDTADGLELFELFLGGDGHAAGPLLAR
jgi:hypothetical protein